MSIITRGLGSTLLITRGYGVSIIRREIIRGKSYIQKTITGDSKIGNNG